MMFLCVGKLVFASAYDISLQGPDKLWLNKLTGVNNKVEFVFTVIPKSKYLSMPKNIHVYACGLSFINADGIHKTETNSPVDKYGTAKIIASINDDIINFSTIQMFVTNPRGGNLFKEFYIPIEKPDKIYIVPTNLVGYIDGSMKPSINVAVYDTRGAPMSDVELSYFAESPMEPCIFPTKIKTDKTGKAVIEFMDSVGIHNSGIMWKPEYRVIPVISRNFAYGFFENNASRSKIEEVNYKLMNRNWDYKKCGMKDPHEVK